MRGVPGGCGAGARGREGVQGCEGVQGVRVEERKYASARGRAWRADAHEQCGHHGVQCVEASDGERAPEREQPDGVPGEGWGLGLGLSLGLG